MKKLLLFFIFYSIGIHAQDSIKKTYSSVISLDKVKVVYRGIDNPITIAVPNAKSYTVSGAGVIATNEVGKYIVKAGSGKEMTFKVEIILNDDSVVVEEHVYQIKGLPAPTGTLNDEYTTKGYLEFTLDELKDAKVDIELIDFLFNVNLEATQFSIKVPRYPTIQIDGNTFTNEVMELLKKAKKKDFIVISNIKGNYMGINQLSKMPSPIVFKIIIE